jgi:hypothetical protein
LVAGAESSIPSASLILNRRQWFLRYSAYPMTAKKLGLTVMGLLLFLACPGQLQNQQRFLTNDSCPAGTDVPRDIFQATCGTAGCHSSTSPQAGLDLVSAGVAQRLINQPSHECAGYILLASPDAGLLFDILQSTPPCGLPQMPDDELPLTSGQIQCIADWANQQNFDGGL